MVDKRSDMGR